jgi:hypothetical protein
VIPAAALRAARRFARGNTPDNPGPPVPLGRGLINDTYLIAGTAAEPGRVLQRLNTQVFSEPRRVMENIVRVSALLEAKWHARRVAEPERHYLKLLPSSDGGWWWVDPDGDWWRCFLFIPRTRGMTAVEDPETAFQAGLAFGRFAADLENLPVRALHCTIPGFHDTLGRLGALEQAFADNPLGRAQGIVAELDCIRVHAGPAEELQARVDDGSMPLRVVHNDTKVDNLLFDRETGEALCVIDLDTVMPGRLVHDFGDLVRNATAVELGDGGQGFSLERFSSLLDGYLTGAGGLPAPTEIAFLSDAGPLLALELGARFLTDYLSGDVYFKTDYSGHNLDRCRRQLSLLEAMARSRREVAGVVTHCTSTRYG